MSTWTNADGLIETYGTARAALATDGTKTGVQTYTMVVELDGLDLPALADQNEKTSSLPANAYITSAVLIADSAWTGTNPTLTIGLGYDNEGTPTAVDADGIDAAIDVDGVFTAAGEAVVCDGALVDGTATIGSNRAWVYAVAGGTVTAGTAKLYLTYFVHEV